MPETTFDKLKQALILSIESPIWLKDFDIDYAKKVESKIKALVPVVTGALKNSIEVSPLKSGINISMLYYGIFLDQGTKYIKAKHFIAKSMDFDISKMIKDNIEKALNETLK